MILHIAKEHVVAGRRQLGALRMRDEKFLQLELAWLELRLDQLDELQVSLLRIGVVRVTGHGDVAAGRFLIERGAEFAPRHEPGFEISHRLGGSNAGFKLIKERSDLHPIAQVELCWYKLTRLECGQRTEWQ